MLRTSACFLVFSLLLSTAAAADIPPPGIAGACLTLKVAANDLASPGDRPRQHYRLLFENRCDAVRIVYWCAEHPSKAIALAPVCMRSTASPNQKGGVAAPLYAVIRSREFQWTFPPGTRIRYVDCSDSSYPTSDFRCTPQAKRP